MAKKKKSKNTKYDRKFANGMMTFVIVFIVMTVWSVYMIVINDYTFNQLIDMAAFVTIVTFGCTFLVAYLTQ